MHSPWLLVWLSGVWRVSRTGPGSTPMLIDGKEADVFQCDERLWTQALIWLIVFLHMVCGWKGRMKSEVTVLGEKMAAQEGPKVGVPAERFAAVAVVVDKLDKLPEEEVRSLLGEQGLGGDVVDALLGALAVRDFDALAGVLGAACNVALVQRSATPGHVLGLGRERRRRHGDITIPRSRRTLPAVASHRRRGPLPTLVPRHHHQRDQKRRRQKGNH